MEKLKIVFVKYASDFGNYTSLTFIFSTIVFELKVEDWYTRLGQNITLSNNGKSFQNIT